MSHERQVKIILSEEFGQTMEDAGVRLIDKRLTDAIGYLALWGFTGRAEKVTIYGDRNGELMARYATLQDEDVFTIGAVPDKNWNYTFHS